jgi:hypothetical protein
MGKWDCGCSCERYVSYKSLALGMDGDVIVGRCCAPMSRTLMQELRLAHL